MAFLEILQKKINALKALVLANSITPNYLGSLLDEILAWVSATETTVDENASAISSLASRLKINEDHTSACEQDIQTLCQFREIAAGDVQNLKFKVKNLEDTTDSISVDLDVAYAMAEKASDAAGANSRAINGLDERLRRESEHVDGCEADILNLQAIITVLERRIDTVEQNVL